ncbi:hypothetical protein F5X68DRAFT_264501 [Plectosphaerella plurivora]|uniref:Xylanolytic transcriptional activator regulatory domain-containing protein n=1 Tax=Plectosphaerella plurivora TaxID=936078 RepID=A0A9P8V5E9_9PEZI|nr:hypothetical protein F5X68DRAFT_264501 [Plectosphaerella plurivora]
MPPWSPSNPGPEPDQASEPAPATSSTGFLPRLDYYLKLADGPVLPDESLPDAEGSFDGQTGQDTQMVDPQLQPAQHHDTQPDESPESSIHGDSEPQGRVHVFPDGRTAFYGSMSLLNAYPPSSSSWNSAEKSIALPRGSLLPPGQEMIERQLMDEYFLYDNFFLPRFTKQLYLSEKSKHENGGDSQLYSPALGHAVLAVGALYADETENSDFLKMSETHAARARQLLSSELQSPRISSVLTLMALCSLSAANGQDSQGWLDSGTASRLSEGLGLDHQMNFSPRLDVLSPADVSDGVLALDT